MRLLPNFRCVIRVHSPDWCRSGWLLAYYFPHAQDAMRKTEQKLKMLIINIRLTKIPVFNGCFLLPSPTLKYAGIRFPPVYQRKRHKAKIYAFRFGFFKYLN